MLEDDETITDTDAKVKRETTTKNANKTKITKFYVVLRSQKRVLEKN